MALIGLDVGTTGCKAIVFGEQGQNLGQAAREYSVRTPRADRAEQDAERVWRLAAESLRAAVAAADDAQPVALALSCQGEAVIPVDKSGRALRDAILGMDTRTGAQNAWLRERFGAEELFARTGMPVHTVNTLPKLLWLKENEPDLWRRADRFLLYEDFFLNRLGGRPVISHCLASRTQMYDLRHGEWAGDILDECGIEPRRLAALPEPGQTLIGELRPQAAAELGLPEGLLLACGGHDQACAALGSGTVRAGRASVSTGTAEVVEVALEEPTLADVLREGGISVYRHVVPGLYVAMTLNQSGGLVLRWFRDELCEAQMRWAAEQGADPYDLILQGAPAEPTDLMVLPHFSGSGTPHLDTRSRGAVLGLSFATDRGTIARAILEGLTFELRLNLELLREGGAEIEALAAVGGGAKSDLWLQLKADVCRLPIHVPQVTEAACLGAALAAGVAAGVYADFASAVEAAVRQGRTFEPRCDVADRYDTRFALYRQLYPTLAPLQRQM
ncbi:MAG: FGGY-family carbohydrate kinase [Candidatus Brocadiia bacterium]